MLLALAVFFSLASCDSPAPAYLGGPVREVVVDDSRFRVFMQHGSRRIEAHRISVEMLPSLVRTLEKAFRAIELATGCQIVPGSFLGDRAIMKAEVDCVIG